MHRRRDIARAYEALVAVAADHADDVDRNARFPREAIDQARESGLLGAIVPESLGGWEASFADTAQALLAVARACGSTALILAMHHSQVACLLNHHTGEAGRRTARKVARGEILVGSSTTEGQRGGEIGSSDCAIMAEGDKVRVRKHGSVISYVLHADGFLVTARADAQASNASQRLVYFDAKDVSFAGSGEWDTLGMRGTCSLGGDFSATADPADVLSAPFEEIHRRTMLPASHILWSAVWLGIAQAALERARSVIKADASAAPGQLRTGDFARAKWLLAAAVDNLLALAMQYDGYAGSAAPTMKDLSRFNALKVRSSEVSLDVVTACMKICGLRGYRNGGAQSVSRHIRDVMSGCLMISNYRILESEAQRSLLGKFDAG